MRRESLKGDMVFDTSIIIEMSLATTYGKELIKSIIKEEIVPYITMLNITEAKYILCRILGIDESLKRIGLILDSNYFTIVNTDTLSDLVSICKCRFPISLADCHTLSLAKKLSLPVLFYKLEKEFRPIVQELKNWINSEILFLVGD